MIVEHGRRAGAHRVAAGEREEHEAAAAQRLDDLVGRGDHADRDVAAAEALAAVDDVGLDRQVLVAPAPAGAPEAGHHLVGDEQDVVATADVGDGPPVVVGRVEAGAGGAGDRLEQERGDRVGPSPRRSPRAAAASSHGTWGKSSSSGS